MYVLLAGRSKTIYKESKRMPRDGRAESGFRGGNGKGKRGAPVGIPAMVKV
jgi:hypothetical protein